jgi:hypothetical protein
MNVLAMVANDWQLSTVFTGGSGAPYGIGYSYQNGANNQVLTGSPDYSARIKIVGDTGKGCTSDLLRQFNTNVFQAPTPPSNGLESGQNYMRGCPNKTFDFALARNIRIGGGRQVQIRAELFNAFDTVVITDRQTTMNVADYATNTVPLNLPASMRQVIRFEAHRETRASAWPATHGHRATCRCRCASSSRQIGS